VETMDYAHAPASALLTASLACCCIATAKLSRFPFLPADETLAVIALVHRARWLERRWGTTAYVHFLILLCTTNVIAVIALRHVLGVSYHRMGMSGLALQLFTAVLASRLTIDFSTSAPLAPQRLIVGGAFSFLFVRCCERAGVSSSAVLAIVGALWPLLGSWYGGKFPFAAVRQLHAKMAETVPIPVPLWFSPAGMLFLPQQPTPNGMPEQPPAGQARRPAAMPNGGRNVHDEHVQAILDLNLGVDVDRIVQALAAVGGNVNEAVALLLAGQD